MFVLKWKQFSNVILYTYRFMWFEESDHCTSVLIVWPYVRIGQALHKCANTNHDVVLYAISHTGFKLTPHPLQNTKALKKTEKNPFRLQKKTQKKNHLDSQKKQKKTKHLGSWFLCQGTKIKYLNFEK